MGPLAFVMTIMGCADGGSACIPARTVPIAYVSREACAAAQMQILADNSDLEFPVIQAECKTVAPRIARQESGGES